MARRVGDVEILARRITDEMLKRMKQPSRDGAQNLNDSGQWKERCEQFDTIFFGMINQWETEIAERNDRERKADPANYINLGDGPDRPGGKPNRVFIDDFFAGTTIKVET